MSREIIPQSDTPDAERRFRRTVERVGLTGDPGPPDDVFEVAAEGPRNQAQGTDVTLERPVYAIFHSPPRRPFREAEAPAMPDEHCHPQTELEMPEILFAAAPQAVEGPAIHHSKSA
jgi:hypothetical protein